VKSELGSQIGVTTRMRHICYAGVLYGISAAETRSVECQGLCGTGLSSSGASSSCWAAVRLNVTRLVHHTSMFCCSPISFHCDRYPCVLVHCAHCRYVTTRTWLADREGHVSPKAFLRGKDVSSRFERIARNFGKTAKKCVT
jgi:hypothetical protein